MYLSKRLNGDIKEITECVMKYPRLENRCLQWVKQVVDLLLNDLRFPKEKVIVTVVQQTLKN
jgi:hypothetical protein